VDSRLEIRDPSVTQVMKARATYVACDIALGHLVAKLPGKQPIGPTASAKPWITGKPTGASLQAHCPLQSAASASRAGAEGRELSDSARPSRSPIRRPQPDTAARL